MLPQAPRTDLSRKLAVTRLHGTAPQIRSRLPLVKRFLATTGRFAEKALVLVDKRAYQALLADGDIEAKHIQLIEPWTGVSSALNGAIYFAKQNGCGQLLVQSLEVTTDAPSLRQLSERVTSEVLVAGAKLTPSHGKVVGLRRLHADSIPWNTLAIWNVELLSLVGFSPMSDEASPQSGMEEVVPISLLKKLMPERAQCLLLSLPGVSWTPTRDGSWVQKMKTKNLRARAQVGRLELPLRNVRVMP